MPKVETQSSRCSGCEGDERLGVRRLRIPVVDDTMRDLDVSMEVPLLRKKSSRVAAPSMERFLDKAYCSLFCCDVTFDVFMMTTFKGQNYFSVSLTLSGSLFL